MDELDEFCKELRALVVSSPVPMDLRSLARDYRSFVGKPMPLQRLGYNSLLSFLKERCSDSFVLQGTTGNPIVTLIVPKAVEHINKLVSKQRLSAKDKMKGKRWSITNRQPDTNKGHNGETNNVSPEPKEGQITNGRSSSTSSESDTHGHNSIIQDSGRASATSMGCSSSSSGRSPAIDVLAEQLTEIITDYPEGLWTIDLMKIYRERFGRELRYERFGVSSGIALMRMLEGTVFHVRRPEALGDWRLYDARRTPPPDDDAPRACTSAPSPPTVKATSDDVMLFMNTICPESIAALEPSVMIDVLVGEIYSPSHFWVLRRDDQHCGLLYAVMDAMTEYYDSGMGAKRCLTDEMEVRAGLYCAARYDRDWHRALVLHLIDADTALLRYIDYGTVGRMPVTSLKPLLKRWGELPAQAVRARLAGVMPPSRARHWPHTSSAEFLQLVRDLALVAEIVAVDYEEGILELFLVDTSTAEEVCVNDLLIQKGFAAQRFDTVLGISSQSTQGVRVRGGELAERAVNGDPLTLQKIESYLRPTFAALEGGVTLSYADICNYIEHGINLTCIDSYRRHVLDEPAQRPPMPRFLTKAATASPSRRSLPSVREESRFLTTLTCLVFGTLLPVNYAIAVEQARNKLNCQCEPDDAAVWLTAAECQHLERLRESNVASAAIYLDRLVRARLPPAADYPASPPPNLLADAAFYSPDCSH